MLSKQGDSNVNMVRNKVSITPGPLDKHNVEPRTQYEEFLMDGDWRYFATIWLNLHEQHAIIWIGFNDSI